RRACQAARTHRRGDRMISAPMHRRSFLTLLGSSAAAWPLAARGQQPARIRRLGVLMNNSAENADVQARIGILRQELRRLGWMEGINLHIEERWPGDDLDRVRADITDFVSLKPDVILATGGRVIQILQQQTRTIPIVFVGIADPLERNLVPSLARPGG